MAVSCKLCGGPHPFWECKASAAQKAAFVTGKSNPVDQAPAPATPPKAMPKKLPAGVVTADKLDPTPKPQKKRGAPRKANPKSKRAAYQRELMAKKRAAAKAAPK